MESLLFNDTFARPLVADDILSVNELTLSNKYLPDGPKTEVWLSERKIRNEEILSGIHPQRELIGTFRGNDLIAVVDMIYSKQLPYWYNVYLEAKYPSSNSLSRDLIHNGIAVSLNLACYRAESRGYFLWYNLRTIRDARAFRILLERSKFAENPEGKHYYEGRGRYNFYPEAIIKAGDLPKYTHHYGLISMPMRMDTVVTLASLDTKYRLELLQLK